MCGICGKLTFDGTRVEEELIRRMTSTLIHRGPDADGIHTDRGDGWEIGLGHRRLSIIDLSDSGRQPMKNEDGTLWMVFNGEIYNFQPIRKALEEKGHRFSSQTDGEVILHLFEEEGVESFRKLAGMFAFALWDKKEKALYLCRDRIGIKPLVYHWDGKTFAFASEIKAILQDTAVAKQMDWQALDLYLTFNYIPAPHTIFERIKKLRPGHYLVFKNGELREMAFWNIPEPCMDCPECDDEEVQKRAIYRLLEDAVRGYMIADVPVAAFLSGGIDSSIIVGLMARNSSRAVKTYSIGYRDIPLYDETSYAREVAVMNGTDHHEIKLSSKDVIDAVPAILQTFDEPFADSSAVPMFIVSRETARDVKVVLSGDGGDELFAGYRMYTGEYLHSKYLKIPKPVRGLMEQFILSLPDSRDRKVLDYVRRAKKFLKGTTGAFEDRFFAWNEIFSRDLRESVFAISNGIDFNRGKKRIVDRLRERKYDNINRMLYTDVTESLPGDMLQKVDAMSMLNSLEVRVPFLDHGLCEMAFKIPGDMKIRRGQGKYILIEAFKSILPPSVYEKPKWGFEMPISRWLKKDLKYLIGEYLSEDRISRQGIFSYPVIRTLVADHLSGRSDTSWQIWNLIVFQAWYQNYFDGNRG